MDGVSVEEAREREFDPRAGELVVQHKAGDKTAMDELYRHYLGPIRAYVMSALGDEEEASDAAQVVFEKALQGIDSYKSRVGTPFRAWLFRIARHVVLDIQKSARRHRELLVTPAAIDALRESPAVEQEMSLGLFSDGDLEFFVRRLTDAQREVVLLHHGLDMTMRQIGEVTGRSAAAAGALHLAAIANLNERFGAVRARRERQEGRHGRRAPMRMRFKPARVIVSRRFALGSPRSSSYRQRRF